MIFLLALVSCQLISKSSLETFTAALTFTQASASGLNHPIFSFLHMVTGKESAAVSDAGWSTLTEVALLPPVAIIS